MAETVKDKGCRFSLGCPPLDLFSIPDSPPAINSVMTATINHCLVPGHWATSEYADTVYQNRSRPRVQSIGTLL